jgi:hypothetical protein
MRSGFDASPGSVCTLRGYGDADYQWVLDAAMDKDANVVIVGNFNGSLDFGNGTLTGKGLDDAFVTRFDSAGNASWSKAFGDGDRQEIERVAVDSDDDIFVTGHFSGSMDFGCGPLTSTKGLDVFVGKLDPMGTCLWSRRLGGAGDQFARGIGVDASGDVFLAGSLWGSTDFGEGTITSQGFEDIFLIKLDPDGNTLWAKTFGDSDSQEPWDLAVDEAGNVALTGYVLGKVDFGNEPTTGSGMPDAFVAKFDGDGNAMWSRRFGDASLQFGQSVATSGEDVVIAGEFEGCLDFDDGIECTTGTDYDEFVAKFDGTGALTWHSVIGGAFNQSNIVVAADPLGNIAVTGSFEGSIDSIDPPLESLDAEDGFVAGLNAGGEILWRTRLGGPESQRGTAIAIDPAGPVVVAGTMWGSIDLDPEVVQAAGPGSDVFVARLSRW